MRYRGLGALLVLAGCNAQPPAAPANNTAEAVVNAAPEAAPPPAAAKPAADAPLAQWLVGHWAYEDDCATDFTVVYSPDGKLDAHGDVGSWAVEGDQVTETITARMGEAGTEPVDPPETVRYKVEKQGADRGLLRRGTQTQAIRRC
ncbi:MAG: hypothetical protein V4574_09505 [Pseudomonadota bacterium]